jgi:site-specific DNA recombinase
MATKSVFIYCRISQDKAGRSEGVQAQERWGRAYATQHWPDLPVRVFADNDVSAAKEDAVRPEFDKLREGILAGRCAQLWTVEQSRLTRLESMWFGLVADLLKAGIDELHTRREGVRRLDDVVGGIMAVLDAAEVRKLRKRINDKMGELAAQGRPIGGNSTAFGYRSRILTDDEQQRLDDWQAAMLAEYRCRMAAARRSGHLGRPSVDMHDWYEAHPRPTVGRAVQDDLGRHALEIVPEQAEAIRQAAEWFLSGWTLTSIAAEFRRRGVKGAKGGQIVAATVKGMLTNPTVAGKRVHQGEIVGEGTWQPILDEATWRAVRAELKTRTADSSRKPAQRHLLSGLLICSTCQHRMTGSNVAVPNAHVQHASYRCNLTPETGGCGRTKVSHDATEEHVIGALLDHLAELGAAGAPADEGTDRRRQLVAELQAVDGRRLELSERWNARKITTQQFDVMNESLALDGQHLERELAELPSPAAKVDAFELREDWPAMTFDEQRTVLRDWIERIVVAPYRPRPSMQSVAERAGVSQGTVWHVLRGGSSNGRKEWGPAADTTVRRVLAAADDLGYVNVGKGRGHAPDGRLDIVWR